MKSVRAIMPSQSITLGNRMIWTE